MKKLMMFAAAMTIVGGAFAQVCSPGTLECALVWNVRLNMKTSMGWVRSASTSAVCAPGGVLAACVRSPNYSYVVDGLIAVCDCTCCALTGDSPAGDPFLFMWDAKWKTSVAADWTWEYVHVLGLKQVATEARFHLDGDDPAVGGTWWVDGGGFGAFKATSPRYYTSFSGLVVGEMDNPICQLVNIDPQTQVCPPADYWECDSAQCDNVLIASTGDPAPLFGTWAIRVNPAASKRYAANGSLIVPSWFDESTGGNVHR